MRQNRPLPLLRTQPTRPTPPQQNHPVTTSRYHYPTAKSAGETWLKITNRAPPLRLLNEISWIKSQKLVELGASVEIHHVIMSMWMLSQSQDSKVIAVITVIASGQVVEWSSSANTRMARSACGWPQAWAQSETKNDNFLSISCFQLSCFSTCYLYILPVFQHLQHEGSLGLQSRGTTAKVWWSQRATVPGCCWVKQMWSPSCPRSCDHLSSIFMC